MATAFTFSTMPSPLGELLLVSDGRGLSGVYPAAHRARPVPQQGWQLDDAFFTGVRDQLDAYFEGRSTTFDIPISATGTSFQLAVWKTLTLAPFGSTWTYGDLAANLGKPNASRAVGLAVGKNPVSIIVPCHRVVGAKGQLTGYASGLEAKKWLLAHEQTGKTERKVTRPQGDLHRLRVVPMTPAHGLVSVAAPQG